MLGLICVPRIQKLEVFCRYSKFRIVSFLNISDQTLCQEICKDFADIAHGFNVIGHLRALCAGGVLENGSDRRYI